MDYEYQNQEHKEKNLMDMSSLNFLNFRSDIIISHKRLTDVYYFVVMYVSHYYRSQ
jgi:hypothetical protein